MTLSGEPLPNRLRDAYLTPPQRVGSERKDGMGLVFWCSVVWIGVVVILSLFAPILPIIQDPLRISASIKSPPSWQHWFGTDAIGRDVFARIVYGARVSITVGLASVIVATIFGGALGLVAGYYRGRIERVIVGGIDVLLAFPALVLALALVAFAGQNLIVLTIVLAVVSIPAIARLARVSTLSIRNRYFVTAARAMGAKVPRILAYEILPNLVPVLVAYGLVRIAVVIVAEGSLSFLGLGIAPPTPSWGNMINEGRSLLDSAPHISLFPALIMFLTVLAFNMIGDRLRGLFDVRESKL